MPRGDGTGPTGTGPMSGRGAGICGNATVHGHSDVAGIGGCVFSKRTVLGLRQRQGRGSMWRQNVRVSDNAVTTSLLKKQAETFKLQLAEIQHRLSELEKSIELEMEMGRSVEA